MKRLPTLVLALISFAGVRAADSAAKPELHGVIITSSDQRFLLGMPGSDHSKWVGVGDEFGPWKLTEYRIKDSLVVLKQSDGTEADLSLAASKIEASDEPKATVADAQRMFEHMHLADMLGKIMANQKQAVGSSMMQNMKKMQGDATPEEMGDFQKQLVDTMFSGVDNQKIQDEAAKIYASEFTPSQLNAIADFYDTPTGQALQQKTPAVQAKMGQVINSQIMANMPKIQEMAVDFAKAHQPGAPAPAPTK